MTATETQQETNPAINNRGPANTPSRHQPQHAIAGPAKYNPSPRRPAAPIHHQLGQSPATSPVLQWSIPPQIPTDQELMTTAKAQRETNPAINNRGPANTPSHQQPRHAIAGAAKHNPSPRSLAIPTHHRPDQSPATSPVLQGRIPPQTPTVLEPTTPTKTQRETNPALSYSGPANKPGRQQPQRAIAGAAKHSPSPRRLTEPTHRRPDQATAPAIQPSPASPGRIPPQTPTVLEPTTSTKTQQKTNPASNHRNPANTPARPQPQRAIVGIAKHNPSPRNPAAPTHRRPNQATATRHPTRFYKGHPAPIPNPPRS